MHGGGPAGPGFTSWHARGGGGHVLGEVRAAEQMCECEPGDGAPRVSHGGVVLHGCLTVGGCSAGVSWRCSTGVSTGVSQRGAMRSGWEPWSPGRWMVPFF